MIKNHKKEDKCDLQIAKVSESALRLLTIVILGNRTWEFVMASIKQRGGTMAKPVEVPQGLSLVKTEITELAGRFSRLVGHNRNVYLPFYEEIFKSVKRDEEQE